MVKPVCLVGGYILFSSFLYMIVDLGLSDLLDLCLNVDGVLYFPLEESLPFIINFVASFIFLGMFLCVFFGDIVFPFLSWFLRKLRSKLSQKK